MNELEQLIADIRSARWPDGDTQGFPTKVVAEMLASHLQSLGWTRSDAGS